MNYRHLIRLSLVLVCTLTANVFAGGAAGEQLNVVYRPPSANNGSPSNPWNTFDYHPATNPDPGPCPAILFVAGTGFKGDFQDLNINLEPWATLNQKAAIFNINHDLNSSTTGAGFNATIFTMANQVGTAIEFIRRRSATYGIDKTKIIGMGTSAGSMIHSLNGYTETIANRRVNYLIAASFATDIFGLDPTLGDIFNSPTLATIGEAQNSILQGQLNDPSSMAWAKTNSAQFVPSLFVFTNSTDPNEQNCTPQNPCSDPHVIGFWKLYRRQLLLSGLSEAPSPAASGYDFASIITPEGTGHGIKSLAFAAGSVQSWIDAQLP